MTVCDKGEGGGKAMCDVTHLLMFYYLVLGDLNSFTNNFQINCETVELVLCQYSM